MYATVIFVKGKKARYGKTVAFFDSVREVKQQGFFRKPKVTHHDFDWCAETFLGTKDYLGKFMDTSDAIDAINRHVYIACTYGYHASVTVIWAMQNFVRYMTTPEGQPKRGEKRYVIFSVADPLRHLPADWLIDYQITLKKKETV